VNSKFLGKTRLLPRHTFDFSNSPFAMPETPSSPDGISDQSPAQQPATGLAPNIAAGIACLFPLLGGIVFLVLEKKNRFVRFWAMQALFLSGLALAVAIVVGMAHLVFGFIPLLGKVLLFFFETANRVFNLAWFVVYVICVVKAFSGQEWEIPWLGRLARAQLRQTDGPPTPPVP
jgi:uncharacterized membrane protein